MGPYMQVLTQLSVGFFLAALIGYLAYRRQSLSASGMLGAIVTGTLIFGLGGLPWGLLLIAFFVSSSALTHYKSSLKEALVEKFSKGGRRDLGQVLANGGAGALFVIANVLIASPWWWVAYAATMATVNADTWATELGVLSKVKPRLVTSLQEVEVGTSGGISLTGTLAALAGAALIGVLAASFSFFGLGVPSLWGPGFGDAAVVMVVVTVCGLLGSLFDSLLGATVQAIYYCNQCHKETERHPLHKCGAPTRPLRGWRWLDNDWVNFLSSVFGAVVAVGLIIGAGLIGLWLKRL
jgi:uncharacterized protein (TIGR00297 family)